MAIVRRRLRVGHFTLMAGAPGRALTTNERDELDRLAREMGVHVRWSRAKRDQSPTFTRGRAAHVSTLVVDAFLVAAEWWLNRRVGGSGSVLGFPDEKSVMLLRPLPWLPPNRVTRRRVEVPT